LKVGLGKATAQYLEFQKMVGLYIPHTMEMDKLTEIAKLMLAMESKFKDNILMLQHFSIHISWDVLVEDQTMNINNPVQRILGTVLYKLFLTLE
jgi:hypothetical protein